MTYASLHSAASFKMHGPEHDYNIYPSGGFILTLPMDTSAGVFFLGSTILRYHVSNWINLVYPLLGINASVMLKVFPVPTPHPSIRCHISHPCHRTTIQLLYWYQPSLFLV